MPLKIKRFQLANYKAVRVVDITPDGDVTLASRENGEGKSSVLDGLEWLLRGPKAAPEVPVRKGTKKARGVGMICDQDGKPVLTVEREKTAAGADKLIVKLAGEDDPASAPQSILDKLFSLVAFEPLKLEKMLVDEPKKFAEQLRLLVGVSTDDLDKKIAELTESRKLVGRDRDGAQARATAAETRASLDARTAAPFPEAPKAEVDVAELSKELERLSEQCRQNDKQRARLGLLEANRAQCQRIVTLAEERLRDAQLEVERATHDLESTKADYATWEKTFGSELAQPEPSDPDTAEIKQQIDAASGVNFKVRANAKHAEERKASRAQAADLAKESDKHAAKYDALTERIDKLRAEKLARIAAVKMPVPGLAFSDDGSVTLEDLPLEQASEGERYRTYAAMAVHQNPQLRALILRDSKDLGPRSRAILAEVAHEHGWQCWWETLDTSTPGALVLEAGSVVQVNPKEAANTSAGCLDPESSLGVL